MEQKCVIWGSNQSGQWLTWQAEYIGYTVVAYCSSHKKSIGKRIGGRLVISPEELKDLCLKGEVRTILLGMKQEKSLRGVKEQIKEMFPQDIAVIPFDSIEDEYLAKHRAYLQAHMDELHWDVKFRDQAEIWLDNFMGEVESWADYANPHSKFNYYQGYIEKLQNEDFLGIEHSCSELAQELRADSIVMDIGCGLAPLYGTRLPKSEHVQLLMVDPLAFFYNRINAKNANWKGRQCLFGMFEFIANFYSENYCDAILINNALDHCIDPYKSVVECLYILKTGGKMRLRHHPSEAVRSFYEGLHKWNIDYSEQDEFIIWNLENAINVSEQLKEVADIRIVREERHAPRAEQMATVEIVKKRDFQLQEFFDMAEERRQLAFLIEGLMRRIAEQDDSYLKNL